MDYAAEYGRLHENGKYFQGFSIKDYVHPIAKLVEIHKPYSLLDYGCGKGHQYLALRVHEAWGGLLPFCYDIGVRGLSEKPGPEKTFGGVICTDMLEHIEEADVPAILEELIAFADSFVFLAIACRPANPKRALSDGRNLHVTVKPSSWWNAKIAAALKTFADPPEVRVVYDEGA